MKYVLLLVGLLVGVIGLLAPTAIVGPVAEALMICGAILFSTGVIGFWLEENQKAVAEAIDPIRALLVEIRERQRPVQPPTPPVAANFDAAAVVAAMEAKRTRN